MSAKVGRTVVVDVVVALCLLRLIMFYFVKFACVTARFIPNSENMCIIRTNMQIYTLNILR